MLAHQLPVQMSVRQIRCEMQQEWVKDPTIEDHVIDKAEARWSERVRRPGRLIGQRNKSSGGVEVVGRVAPMLTPVMACTAPIMASPAKVAKSLGSFE